MRLRAAAVLGLVLGVSLPLTGCMTLGNAIEYPPGVTKPYVKPFTFGGTVRNVAKISGRESMGSSCLNLGPLFGWVDLPGSFVLDLATLPLALLGDGLWLLLRDPEPDGLPPEVRDLPPRR